MGRERERKREIEINKERERERERERDRNKEREREREREYNEFYPLLTDRYHWVAGNLGICNRHFGSNKTAITLRLGQWTKTVLSHCIVNSMWLSLSPPIPC